MFYGTFIFWAFILLLIIVITQIDSRTKKLLAIFKNRIVIPFSELCILRNLGKRQKRIRESYIELWNF